MKGDRRSAEFFVGYHPVAPAGQGRWLRRCMAVVLIATPIAAIALSSAQRGFVPAAFEYGHRRTIEGWIEARPYPMLVVPRPGTGGASRYSRIILAGQGKHGADADIAGLDGRAVKLEGTLAYRDDQVLLEIARQSLPVASTVMAAAPVDQDQVIGPAELEGEVIDPKCALGVMNPGTSKPHRSCAARCLSGGLPPMLLVRDSLGGSRYYFLVGPDGGPLHEAVLPFAAEPIRVRGVVSHRGDALYLAADPDSYERLSP